MAVIICEGHKKTEQVRDMTVNVGEKGRRSWAVLKSFEKQGRPSPKSREGCSYAPS